MRWRMASFETASKSSSCGRERCEKGKGRKGGENGTHPPLPLERHFAKLATDQRKRLDPAKVGHLEQPQPDLLERLLRRIPILRHWQAPQDLPRFSRLLPSTDRVSKDRIVIFLFVVRIDVLDLVLV